MEFNSLKEMIEMGGHGAYVWSAYGVFLVTVVVLVIQPLRRYKSTLRRVADQEALSLQRENRSLTEESN